MLGIEFHGLLSICILFNFLLFHEALVSQPCDAVILLLLSTPSSLTTPSSFPVTLPPMGLLPRTQLSLLPSVSTLPAVSFRGCSVHDCSPVPSAELQVHTLDFGRSFLLGNIAQALAFFKSPGLSHMCIAQSFVFLTSASVSYCILPSLLSGASILACFYSWTQLHWAPSLDGSHFHPSDLFTSDQLRHLDGFTVSFGEVGGLSPPAEQSLSILSYRKTVQIPVPPFSVPPLTSASLPTT